MATAPTCVCARGGGSPKQCHVGAPPAANDGGVAQKCDKCDGPHATEDCTNFQKERVDHPDARRRDPHADIGAAGGNAYLAERKTCIGPRHCSGGRHQHADAAKIIENGLRLAETGRAHRYLAAAEVVRQPGDGSCLFHSICYFLLRRGRRPPRGTSRVASTRRAATPRPRRGHSAAAGRGDAAAETWTFRGDESR